MLLRLGGMFRDELVVAGISLEREEFQVRI